jgi:hypothetical protein
MSYQEEVKDYILEVAIGGTRAYIGTISSERDLESWREFARGDSNEATYVGGSFSSVFTTIEVKNGVAEIHLETDWCAMATELPAALVRAEIARCLEEPVCWD